MREIVLDTETTGLDPRKGDRLIEIGCIELVNRIPTGREFHRFINPERTVPAEAEAVHGLSTEFLLDKPLFTEVAEEFLDFIAGDMLVIHNAVFDVGFLNAELERLGQGPPISMSRVVDTLQLARRKHPAGPNSLDALCKRYGIDNSKRIKHGALMDSLLLAEVYVELLGERQASLVLGNDRANAGRSARGGAAALRGPRPVPLPVRLTEELIAAHRAFVETLGPKALWKRYFAPDEAA
ncbi:DNA polymerase III subunit epsilon [Hyphomicrobium sp.]|uniref:DNA polymerase III subunit epsilon n=1 Tax=Hyphomicrobium sp. TaxID=82 RepID=UPI0025C01230|nr:DNA polymerase III subunit epsilon [Hyphomicrobium sp.]MCC7253100.1 DNA polymerase III subunit epsilon [Hyphomicrobium sp.]